MRARVPLDDGRLLVVDEAGGRWLATRTSSGWIADAVPEPSRLRLRHVARRADGSYLFLAEGGEAFAAPAPDAPLELVATTSRLLDSYASIGSSVLGVDPFGGVLRLERDGWTPVAVPHPVHRLVAGAAGFVALGFPERISATGADGATFLRAPLEEVGAFDAMARDDGTVLVEGVRGLVLRTREGSWRDAMPSEGLRASASETMEPHRGPSARALLDGRASLSGRSYAELEVLEASEAAERREASLALWHGDLAGPLTRVGLHLPLGVTCDPVGFARRDDRVSIACASGTEAMVWSSRDFGRTWPVRVALPLEATSRVALAYGPSGTLLLAGIGACASARCDMTYRLAPGATTLEAIMVADRGRSRPALEAPFLDWSGPRPIAFGLTEKHGLAPFVSDDDGHTFRPLPLSGRAERAKAFVRRFQATTDVRRIRARTWGDASLSLELDAGAAPVAARIASDGTVVATVTPRGLGEVLAISGARGRWLLATRGHRTDRRIDLWQTLDDGASFDAVAPPSALSDERREALELFCNEDACVVGDELTRFGWTTATNSLPSVAALDFQARAVVAQTPLVCALRSSGFQPIDDVEAGALPAPEDAFRGDSPWSLLLRPEDGSAVTLRPRELGPHGEVRFEKHVLFPSPGRERTAERIEAEAEGWVGVRAVSMRTGGHRLDVAWDDLAFGRRGRGVVRTGSLPSAAFGAGPRPFLHGVSLALTPRGAWLRLAEGRESYFVDPTGRVDGPLVFGPTVASPLARVETATFAEGPIVVTAHVDARHAVRALTTVKLGGGGRHDAAVAPPATATREVSTHWSYEGESAGVVVHVLQRDRTRASSAFVPLPLDARAPTGVNVPTQLDLGAAGLTPCTERDRRSTPRVIAPFLRGSRHPVIVDGQSEPLMTSEAILHGTPERPCVLGFVAEPPRRGGVRAFVALDGRSSWLLQVSPTRLRGLDVAPMECSESPAASAPPWVRDFAATEELP